MMFVYVLTTIIATTWIIKMIRERKLLIRKTPLDIPLLLFLLANILSTYFSIDPHTSWWGYYSRSNGGLLSTISYITLYYAFVSFYQGKQVYTFLKVALAGGLAVALWAIPEHFGVSPSCALLTNQLDASCWVQDVQSRVFATLGQPNWLAAYLAMLLFPAIYFFLTTQSLRSKIGYYLLMIALYMAFTFTYSRGAAFGVLGGLGVLVLGVKYPLIKARVLDFRLRQSGQEKKTKKQNLNWSMIPWKGLGLTLAGLVLVNVLFGSALTDYKLINKFAPPPRPSVSLQQRLPSGTQLENGGTESGQIRLIVWKGALEIFKHYPLFGSGVETFAYSYYNFRPAEHNLVSEWEFLYNKAHNEYLNYLATTGIMGFISYLAVIGYFLFWTTRQFLKADTTNEKRLLLTALLAAYVSYLIQNIFGFSVVIIALLFYLIPALIFAVTENTQAVSLEKARFYHLVSHIPAWIYRRRIYTKTLQLFFGFIALLILLRLSNYWIADTFYSLGSRSDENGNPARAYNYLIRATDLNSYEPLYHSELGYAAAGSAVVSVEDATSSASLIQTADEEIQTALRISPKNTTIYRTAIRAYYFLSTLDASYYQKTLETFDQAIKLAPTDPKLLYNKAKVLADDQANATDSAVAKDKINEAISSLKKAIELKPNYRDAHYALGLFYYQNDQKKEAIEEMKTVLTLIHDDAEAAEKLKSWE